MCIFRVIKNVNLIIEILILRAFLKSSVGNSSSFEIYLYQLFILVYLFPKDNKNNILKKEKEN